MSSLNTAGWHFHSINEDRTRGGHVLQVSIKDAEASFDLMNGFEMTLFREDEFQKMDLARKVDETIHRSVTAMNGQS